MDPGRGTGRDSVYEILVIEMNANDLVKLVVGVVVGALMLSAILIPTINEATTTEHTFTNEGLYYMTNPTESVHVEYLGGTEWRINDEPLVYTVLGATNIIVFDDTFIRNVGQVRGDTTVSFNNADFTIDNGTITGTYNDGTGTIDWTYTERCYVATNDKSAWTMTNNTGGWYIKSDSQITGIGLTTVKDSDGNNQIIVMNVEAVGLEATVTTPTTAVTISDIVVNAIPVNGYNDLYQFTSITFKATWGTNVTNCTYNIVIVPSEVTAELSIHASEEEIQILEVIPILVTVGLILGVVGVAFSRRD